MSEFTFSSSLKEITKEIDKYSRQNVQEACKYARKEVRDVLNVKRRSKPNEPPGRLSGTLWKSIRYQVKKEIDGSYDGLVGSTDWKAHMMEFGSKNMGARPFLLRTLNRISPELRKIMSGKLVE